MHHLIRRHMKSVGNDQMKVRFQRKNIKIRKEINNMPNWCEGMLKIRGKQEDVFCLLINNLSVWKTVLQKEPSISIVEIPDEDGIKIDVKNKTIHVNNLAYIKGTCRNFVEPNDIEVLLLQKQYCIQYIRKSNQH